jgi:hypothetical protein
MFNHPLTLTGVTLFGVLALLKLILKSGLLRKVGRRESAPILHKLLNFSFLLALSVVVAGFGLEGWKIYKQTDRSRQATKVVIGDVLTSITSLDERLEYFQDVSGPDDAGRQLDEVRQKVAPALRADIAAGYRRMIMEQQISALRQMMNSSPLAVTRSPSLMENLQHSGMDTETFRRFHGQLAEVERVTEDLLNTLEYLGKMEEAPGLRQMDYGRRRLALSMRNITIESQIAYLYALEVLRDASTGPQALSLPESAAATLKSLAYLKPKEWIGPEEAALLLSELMLEKAEAALEKKDLLSRAEKLRQEELQRFAALDERLRIQPTDTWREVVGKAISLRRFGRIAEAVAAFSRYAEMFAPVDPTARRYAHTAQQFTIQLDMLGVTGGVYIYEIRPGSAAEKCGLAAGDIIIAYNGRVIGDMPGFVDAERSAQAADTVSIGWLRLNAQDRFERHENAASGGSLGLGAMPI